MITAQFDVEFTRDGAVFDTKQETALLKGLAGATDLLVVSHGWNNDMAEARTLYDTLLGHVNAHATSASGAGSAIVVLRVFWPSKKFADADLIPGGGAASATAENDAALKRALLALKREPASHGHAATDPVVTSFVDTALAQLPNLEHSESARRAFVAAIRKAVTTDDSSRDDASREFLDLDAEQLFDRFSEPVPVELTAGTGGVASVGDDGGAAGFLGDLLSGTTAAARRIANFATYMQMKGRAGTVGRTGLASTLTRVRAKQPNLPIHLVGHSFGGRLVTAAASQFPPGSEKVTLTLLQAAFSHNGLARHFDDKNHDGAFRTVLQDKRVSGPVAITHTKNDKAVGVAYPLASRIALDSSASLGDENDPYGGMGRNGAQHTPEVDSSEVRLKKAAPGVTYAFVPGKVYNLLSDALISGHSDVTSTHVGKLIAEVIARA